MGLRLRLTLPTDQELTALAIAAAGHLALFAVLLSVIGPRTGPRPPGPALTVSLAGPGAETGRRATFGAAATTRSRTAAAPSLRTPDRPFLRAAVQPAAKTAASTSTAATAQPDQLPRADAAPPASSGGPVDGAQALDLHRLATPEGPLAGGVAGVGLDGPGGADWYNGLVTNRLQDAWRDRPLLPAGEAIRRTIVVFDIERDGRLANPMVESPSGYSPLDNAALRAVLSLGRLPPLPTARDQDRRRMRFVFELTAAPGL